MKTEPPELPAAVKDLSLVEKIDQLRQLAPHRVVGLEIVVDALLADAWQDTFGGAPRSA
jgi:hypothetical protein